LFRPVDSKERERDLLINLYDHGEPNAVQVSSNANADDGPRDRSGHLVSRLGRKGTGRQIKLNNIAIFAVPPLTLCLFSFIITRPAGYRFDADINGDPAKRFTCEIPEGGVTEGQVFLAPLMGYDGPRLDAPTGGWKDGAFDCCNAGTFP
jgi:hypothetical protein